MMIGQERSKALAHALLCGLSNEHMQMTAPNVSASGLQALNQQSIGLQITLHGKYIK